MPNILQSHPLTVILNLFQDLFTRITEKLKQVQDDKNLQEEATPC